MHYAKLFMWCADSRNACKSFQALEKRGRKLFPGKLELRIWANWL